ncbi:MAG: DNA polymerase III subunit gamma/tau [Firmicutes bacterium]|nr:DNA polymerase III subunit gamma/tau [Bacillota bacterium]
MYDGLKSQHFTNKYRIYKALYCGAFFTSYEDDNMAYRALYRRLRPQTFDEVIGQQHIIKTLKNQIETGRISHAYLFCGTRGTGKTSTAKIFARAINCTSNGDKPCNECESCKAILQERNVNVVEIDAASNNSVDNVRDITEEVKYPPSEGRYRVYIIDEVHMLSNAAFNALLKTLEEPPEYVVFILATTDPQKLLSTVLSRCQRFDFHRITVKEMTEVLGAHMKEENVDIDDEALAYIAETSDGAMRDALSLLDMCMSFYYGERITADKVREITGAVDRNVFFALTDAIARADSAAALDIVEDMSVKGRDIHQFISDCVLHIRNLLVARTVDKSCAALNYSDSYIEKLRLQAQTLSFDYLSELITLFSQLQTNVKQSFNPRILLEVTCIKACTPYTVNTPAALEKRLITVEQKIEKGITVTASAPVQTKLVKEDKVKEKAVPDDINTMIKNWRDFAKTVDDPPLKILFMHEIQPAYLEDNILTLVCEYQNHFDIINKRKDEVKKYLFGFAEKEFDVRAMLRTQYDKRHRELYGHEDDTLEPKSIEDSFGRINFDVDIQ